jgi:hypothetical protein
MIAYDKRKAFTLALALFIVLLLGLTVVPVTADEPPAPPERHYFHGAVMIAGSPAPPGTRISAHWDSSSKETTVDINGNYGKYPDVFYIEENGINPGDEITFKVSGVTAATRQFNAPDTTELNLSIEEIPTQLTGVTYEVSCDILPAVTVELFQDSISKGSTTSGGDGSYTLPAPASGTYDVVASKGGFRDETQTDIAIVEGVNTVDFRGNTSLIPNAPDVFYVLECVNLWLYGGEDPCALTVFKVLAVVNAWLYPV